VTHPASDASNASRTFEDREQGRVVYLLATPGQFRQEIFAKGWTWNGSEQIFKGTDSRSGRFLNSPFLPDFTHAQSWMPLRECPSHHITILNLGWSDIPSRALRCEIPTCPDRDCPHTKLKGGLI
jgi:hypothetical protein